MHPLSNIRRRRCLPSAVSLYSSSFQNKSCAQSERKCRTTTSSRVRKSLRHHRQFLAQVNLLPQFIIKLLHIIIRYQFLWSAMVTLRILKIFAPLIENISSSQREGRNQIKIAILRRHYWIVLVANRGELYCSIGKSRIATKLNNNSNNNIFSPN